MASRRALGRGLENVFADTLGARRSVPLSSIEPNPRQPRQGIGDGELEGLAASIRRHGVLQPVMVSARDDHPGRYYLVAGERRWRAARLAGLREVPATIVTVDDRQQLELALVENLQRTDLDPLDRSQAYRVMLEEFELTQEGVAEALGVSRSSVANALRLLNLDEASLDALRAGEISEGHARALLSVADVAARGRLLAAIKKNGLSVREAERWAAAGDGDDRSQEAPASRSPTEAEIAWNREVGSVLERIQRNLGTRVRLRGGGRRGRIVLEYYSEEELAQLIDRLTVA
ncbi:MAG: ParB/RepB/Spo0J family partition protein [Chloroflexi bacterium]|nr:ParB/RepB/Spo0J family partition protein [Chloroflexota bacterium]